MNFKKTGLIIAAALGVIVFMLNRQKVELTSQTDFEVTKISPKGYEIKWVIHFYNPNLLSSTIQKINEKLYVEGKELGELKLELSQGIPGRKETSFPVSVRFTSTDSGLANIPIPVLMKGEISFSNLTGGGAIQVNELDTAFISQ